MTNDPSKDTTGNLEGTNKTSKESSKAEASGQIKTTEKETIKTTTPANDSRSFLLSIAQYIAFTLLTLAFVVFIIYGTGGHGFLESLSDAATARGLITFLITVVTVAIALILTLASIISSSPDLKDRFAQGKEVLTVLIGVLGTIVGFYYGQAASPQTAQRNANVINANASNSNASNSNINNSNRGNANRSNTNSSSANVSQAQRPQVVPTFISNREPKKGETIPLITRASDGKALRTYPIKYSPGGIGEAKDKSSPQ